jgi:hypothetical protein
MNCKPGDLAVVVNSPFVPENIGAIVTVICAEPTGECHLDSKNYPGRVGYWMVKMSRPSQTVNCRTKVRSHHLSIYAACADSYLRPIRGEPESVNTRHSDPVSA